MQLASIVLSSIALHGIALHRIAWHCIAFDYLLWYCMVLHRLHGVVQLIWRAGELPRSASSHFGRAQPGWRIGFNWSDRGGLYVGGVYDNEIKELTQTWLATKISLYVLTPKAGHK